MAGLFAAVWAIYLGDRLFDARRALADTRSLAAADLPERHAWARRHRAILAACLVLAILFGAATIPLLDPSTRRAGFYVAVATGLYFLLFRWSVLSRVRVRGFPAKEIAIAACFTAGAAVAATPDAIADLPVVALAGLGSLILGNCLLISRRETSYDQLEDPAAFFALSTRARLLPEIALVAAFAFGACGWWQSGFNPTSLALMLCASLTLILSRTSRPVLVRRTQPIADGLHLLVWVITFLF